MTAARKLLPGIALKSAPGRAFSATVYTADMAPDLDGDAAAPSSFAEGQPVVISAWAHSSMSDALPVGKGTIRRDGTAIIVDGVFFDTAAGGDAHKTIRELREHVELSIGYRALRWRNPTGAELSLGIKRILLEVEVLEVSFVLRGAAGPGRTGVREIKTARSAVTVDLAAIAAQVRAREAILNPPTVVAARYKVGMAAYHRKFGVQSEVVVDSARFAFARDLAGWFAPRCGVVPPGVKFFAPAAVEGAIVGQYRHGDRHIWISSACTGEKLVRTVAHETAHYARHVRGLPNVESEVWRDEHALFDLYSRSFFSNDDA